jgi:hypothetical protein
MAINYDGFRKLRRKLDVKLQTEFIKFRIEPRLCILPLHLQKQKSKSASVVLNYFNFSPTCF